MKADAITAVADVTNLDYKHSKVQKDNTEFVIGSEAEGTGIVAELNSADRVEFFASVRVYYQSACDYIVSKFPLKSDVLTNVEVADIANQVHAKFFSIRFFIDKFPSFLIIKEENKHEDIDALQGQFVAYQVNYFFFLVIL